MIDKKEVQERINAWKNGYWEIPENLDLSGFDLNWRPNPVDRPYIHQFGTQWQKTGGPRFIVLGATEVKYVDYQKAQVLENKNVRCWRNLDNVEFDLSWHPDDTEPPFIYQFDTQWQKHSGPRYVVPGATQVKYLDYPIAIKKQNPNDRNWRGSENIEFDFSWHPHVNDPPFIYQFGTQWQKTGGPRYVVPGATQIKYVEFPKANKKQNISDRNWRGAENIEFDFSWHPDDTEPPYIYQFGTQHQKTGGPRYVVPGATQIKYVEMPRAKALPTNANWVKLYDIDESSFDFSWHPDNTEQPFKYAFGNQWRTAEETPTVIYNTPKASKFKYIDSQKARLIYKPLDIVFVSNGETGQHRRYEHLCEVSNRTVKWVKDINGREQALKKAAEISETEWLILVPGKLKIDKSFDFEFQPNRFIEPKHYIFYAKNPLNGLKYGHMAVVVYNKKLLLETELHELDITMSKLHDIVPIISGLAEFNADPFMTWRTAFREVIKLRKAADANDSESIKRLNVWLNKAKGKNAEYCILGAKQGNEFYDQVSGDNEQLMMSFHWDWLEKKFTELNNKY